MNRSFLMKNKEKIIIQKVTLLSNSVDFRLQSRFRSRKFQLHSIFTSNPKIPSRKRLTEQNPEIYHIPSISISGKELLNFFQIGSAVDFRKFIISVLNISIFAVNSGEKTCQNKTAQFLHKKHDTKLYGLIFFSEIRILQFKILSTMRDVLDCVEAEKEKGGQEKNEREKKSGKAFDIRQGCWDSEEQKKYLQFLESHRDEFKSTQKRRKSKIFKEMSEFIGSRDGGQCRSHHIKQLIPHMTVGKLLRHSKKKAQKSQQRNTSQGSQPNPVSPQLEQTFFKPSPIFLFIPTFTWPGNLSL